jgi:Tetratricopeptide repeat
MDDPAVGYKRIYPTDLRDRMCQSGPDYNCTGRFRGEQMMCAPWAVFVRAGIVAGAALIGSMCASAQIIGDCGDPFQSGPNSYGPFDYRTATPDQRGLVERYHFTPNIEALQSGNTSAVGGEIDYTLRVFPNSPRALMAMVRLGQKEKTTKPNQAKFTIECYLERATQFRPDDPNVWLVRGIYYALQHKNDVAIDAFNAALQRAPDNANVHYNLGLAYFDTKQYDKAVEEAKLAKSLGFPLGGLKNKLSAAGQWRD